MNPFGKFYGAAALGCALLIGCSSGSVTPSAKVTRDSEPTLSQDALILAAGLSSTPWVELSTAQQIDADLKSIRANQPALVGIHARGTSDPKSVLLSIEGDAPWLKSWRAGRLPSGVSALDTALTDYRATKIEVIDGSPNVTAAVHFDQWMNTKNLAEALKPLSDKIADANLNYYAGDGDRLEVATPGKVYRFSHGFGDCEAGCISRHYWTATRSGDGWSVVESGDALGGG